MDKPTLPKLPEPAAWKVAASYFTHHDSIPPGLLPPVAAPDQLFTAAQMIAAMAQAAREQKERDAALCRDMVLYTGYDCAAAILAQPEPQATA